MASGQVTSEQLVSRYSRELKAYDQAGPRLNAVIAINPRAATDARELDRERRERGPRGPLHGIPVLLKDNYDTADMPTTGGSLALVGSCRRRTRIRCGCCAGWSRAARQGQPARARPRPDQRQLVRRSDVESV
jgi:hypothetical protein